MYYKLIMQMRDSLSHFIKIMEKVEAQAEEDGIEPSVYLEGKLAEDMFDFTRQVQTMSDTAKFTAARMSGKTAPSFPDEESSFPELIARLEKTILYLNEFTEDDFQGAAEREIDLPFMPGFYAPGADYFAQFSIPNFYFHLTTGYDILRHKGADIGKRDYIGMISMIPREE
jgi:hypothetical protein